jgi:two-component system sensor histidine kinase KdpD
MPQDNEEIRPSPEELLKIAKEEENQVRGKLTIYLGYAPGVGKTYAMLYDAHLRKKEGIDVVVGYVETHGRTETEALLDGLEVIEPLIVEYNGLTLKEADFHKILKRKPRLAIIDELPHSNPPDFLHPRRYQDIEDVLNAGIDVYTAMNIQHIESLNDLIFQITGITVKETVPDKFIEQASEIKLVDLTPEELLKRLKEGKVYIEDMAQAAIKRYFKHGNLLALRQIALRIVADKVDEKMFRYMKQHAIAGPWAIKERILVGIFASPYADQLIRAAYRFATEIDATWVAVHVETQKNKDFTETEKQWLDKAIGLAQELGGEMVWLKGGSDVADEIINYAKEHNVTKIVIGKPRKFGFFIKTIPEKLIVKADNVDIFLLSPKEKKAQEFFKQRKLPITNLHHYLIGICNITLTVAICYLTQRYLNHTNLLALFLLALTINAFFLNIPAVILSSIIGILTFDFFFVKPIWSFYVTDYNLFWSLLVYTCLSMLISVLSTRLRNKVRLLGDSRKKEVILIEISTSLLTASRVEGILSIVVSHLKKIFDCEIGVFLAHGKNLKLDAKTKLFDVDKKAEGIVYWVFFNNKEAGHGTDTFPASNTLFLPLTTTKDIYGVVGISFHKDKKLHFEDRVLLNTISHLMAVAIERIKLFHEVH